MHICLTCGKTFFDPVKRVETTASDSPGSQCRWCGSTDIEEAVSCQICGAPTGITQGKYHMCAQCEIDTDNRFKEHLKGYTQDQIDYLNNQYEDRYFKI